MKMKYALAIAICIMILTGCVRYHSERIREGRTSITIKESDHQYRMDAKFSRSKTSQVASIIDQELDRNSSLDPEDLDGTITLEDDSKVYVKLRSGRLKIRFDKDDNSETAYDRIKDLGDKIKATIHNSQAQLQ
ncbi:hypothetical protein BC659_1773 [Sediminibacterium goheungense]|uniref:Uncharacterized protein n=2 Tax=Sediminibacterium goheungense TaxID=1086393 RepID=A0A4R6IVT4_9BACT|nr:hypothetical protein BC659_1773 [Sediminibacterium goheungense]